MAEPLTLSLDGHVVPAVLHRSARRSIGLRIDADGLQIRAPRAVSMAVVQDVARQRRRWILAALQRQGERQRQADAALALWHDAQILPYLGQPLTVITGAPGTRARFDGDVHQPQAGARLYLPPSPASRVPGFPRALLAWLQAQARQQFQARLTHFLSRGELRLHAWRLSSARTRWGSCTSRARICLNWRLIHYPVALIDYMVAHEVAHLAHLHHGPAFWRMLEQLLPQYATAQAALRQHRPDQLPWFAF